MERNEASVRELHKSIADKSGGELLDFIQEDFKELQDIMYNARSVGTISVLYIAANWLNTKMEKWLGEKNTADILSKSAENNPASEMGLEMLDVADVVRQYPAVIEYFHHPSDETFFEDLAEPEGGEAVSRSMRTYLEKNGMRCSGEFDMTRPRWSEQQTTLVPMILGNIKNFEPNAHKIVFEQGRLEAEQKAQGLLHRLERMPGGKRKAKKQRR